MGERWVREWSGIGQGLVRDWARDWPGIGSGIGQGLDGDGLLPGDEFVRDWRACGE